MSIKSFTDEFDFEAVDKSYDVKSLSAESLACSDDDEYLVVELMHKMTPAVLSKLRRCFKTAKDKSFRSDIDRRVEDVMRAAAAEEGIEFAVISQPNEDQLWISEQKFMTALEDIFGHHRYTTHAQKLFQLLDPFGTGKACWSKLVDRLVVLGARRTRSRVDEWKDIDPGVIKKVKHCKRETIVKIVDIDRAGSFCYVVVTRGGRVGVYSGDLKLLLQYEVFCHRTGVQKRVKNCWITDAIYMNNVQVLVLSASDRSLTFYDITTLTHTPIYCITGMPNIPTCMAYCPSSQGMNVSELALGTEQGEVLRLRFLRANVSLFHNNSSDRVNYYFWMELSSPPHQTYCSIVKRRVHSRSVRRLIFIKDGEVLLSCSHDNKISVTAISLPGRLQDYVYSVQRGVTCFHIVSPLHLLATGSADGVVRLYDVTQTEPHAQLKVTARVAIVDVVIVAANEIILAVCSDCTVHIWDMYEECLLQTIKMKFPFLSYLGKKVEFGSYSIHPGPGRVIPAPTALSRRSSSVLTASGGLVLNSEEERNWTTRALEDDNEYNRFARSELIISCRDYICILTLHDSPDPLKSPPKDSLAARRPSLWDGPKIKVTSPRSPNLSESTSPSCPIVTASDKILRKCISLPQKVEDLDLEKLLEKAGLQGILEKDFVLMQGLKNDLNQKLAEMECNMDAMNSAVSVGAPYLALKTFEPVPMEPINEMTDDYVRVMGLFPGPSIAGTPSGSVVSTPRTERLSKLSL